MRCVARFGVSLGEWDLFERRGWKCCIREMAEVYGMAVNGLAGNNKKCIVKDTEVQYRRDPSFHEERTPLSSELKQIKQVHISA